MNWPAINELSLNWVDWLVIAVVLFSTALSLWRGFVREALSLGAWILAFIAAGLFAEPLAVQMSGLIDNVTGRFVAAYVCIFVGVLVCGTAVIYVMGKVVRVAGLSTLDRLLGTVFGFTRGMIVVLVVVFIARQMFPLDQQQALMESEVMPHLEMIAYWMRSVFMDINASWNSGISV